MEIFSLITTIIVFAMTVWIAFSGTGGNPVVFRSAQTRCNTRFRALDFSLLL